MQIVSHSGREDVYTINTLKVFQKNYALAERWYTVCLALKMTLCQNINSASVD